MFVNKLPDFIYENLRSYSANANSYHPQPKELISKIAQRHSIPEEMIYLTAGADEAIYLFGKAYGQQVYTFTPAFISYADIENIGAHVEFLDALDGSNYTITTEKIPHASLIFLANPNNPFGVTFKEKIIELIENNQHAIVVIDEVYAEFADLSVIDLTTKYPNLAVMRSFSKSFGMAGNRIGYVVAHPSILSTISIKNQWANISYLSVGAAITALDHEDYFRNLIREVSERRERFQDFLKEHNFTILPTKINAALITFENEEKGTEFYNYLLENNFVTSHGNGDSNIGLDKSFVRISIGSEEEMQKLKDVILKFT